MHALEKMGFTKLGAKYYAQKSIDPNRIRNKNFTVLAKEGIYLPHNKDSDKDGIKNKDDCQPLNPKKQGVIHDWQMRRLREEQEYERLKNAKLKAEKKLSDQALMEKRKVDAMRAENDKIKTQLKERSLSGRAKAELKRRWNSEESIKNREFAKKKAITLFKKLKKVRL